MIEPDEAYVWATYAGAELDLLMFKDGKRYPAATPNPSFYALEGASGAQITRHRAA